MQAAARQSVILGHAKCASSHMDLHDGAALQVCWSDKHGDEVCLLHAQILNQTYKPTEL